MQGTTSVNFNNNELLSEINQIAKQVSSNQKIKNLINQQNELENILNQNNLRKIDLQNAKHEVQIKSQKIEQQKLELQQREYSLSEEEKNSNIQKISLMDQYGISINDHLDSDQINQGMKILKQMVLAEKFYGIFHKEKPTSEQLTNLISNHLQKTPFVEEKIDGKTIVKIQSMIPVINYMKLNPQVTLCKFIAFKSNVSDVVTLCDYLKAPECKIRAVGVSKEISQESKDLLSSVTTVKAQFRVVYQ